MADQCLCSITTCSKTAFCRGYCSAHYSRLLAHGSPISGSSERNRQPEFCIVDGCGKKPKAKSLCHLHYNRMRLTGSYDAPSRRTASSCSVYGCESAHVAKGYCGVHYRQFMAYGDPLVKRRRTPAKSSDIREWVQKNLEFDGHECLIWPFSRTASGYGQIQDDDGSATSASRYICKVVHGEPPSGKHFAAHDCGNGNKGCVHPKHLYWATPQQNTLDRYRHGTMCYGEAHPSAKLSQQDVDRIKDIGPHMKQRDIAKLFGVCKSTIGNILRGDNWSTS